MGMLIAIKFTVSSDPLKGGEDVIYSQGKGQLMVSPRDFCVARRWKPTNDGGFDMVMRSIVHKVSCLLMMC